MNDSMVLPIPQPLGSQGTQGTSSSPPMALLKH